jgi:hypothetical protein
MGRRVGSDRHQCHFLASCLVDIHAGQSGSLATPQLDTEIFLFSRVGKTGHDVALEDSYQPNDALKSKSCCLCEIGQPGISPYAALQPGPADASRFALRTHDEGSGEADGSVQAVLFAKPY